MFRGENRGIDHQPLSEINPLSPSTALPQGITYDWNTLWRTGVRGDNWCMTWAKDGHLYTMMDDGFGFVPDDRQWNARLIRIAGGPDFKPADTHNCPGWPYHPHAGMGSGFYGYGTYAVGSRIYTWVWKSQTNGYSRPIANRLMYTDDYGETFYNWMGEPMTEQRFARTDPHSFFFYKEQPQPKEDREAYAFNWLEFCQMGQANTLAKDQYVYLYSVEQVDCRRLGMMRVPHDKLCDKQAYEYLVAVDAAGVATWSFDPAQRGTTHVFTDHNRDGLAWLWCSWHPSVVYNAGLGLYLMVSYGIRDSSATYWSGWCKKDSDRSAMVQMLYAHNPWGPWTTFYRQDEWKAPVPVPSELGFSADASRTYQFKLNPKWISADGKTMYLHWSDAGGRWDAGHHGHDSYWYRWNQVQIQLIC